MKLGTLLLSTLAATTLVNATTKRQPPEDSCSLPAIKQNCERSLKAERDTFEICSKKPFSKKDCFTAALKSSNAFSKLENCDIPREDPELRNCLLDLLMVHGMTDQVMEKALTTKTVKQPHFSPRAEL